MANLYSELKNNRMTSRGSHVHRLGDSWVEARVQNWEYGLMVELNSEGWCSIYVRNIRGAKASLAWDGPIDVLFRAVEMNQLVAKPKEKKSRRGHQKSALDRDIEAFIERTA